MPDGNASPAPFAVTPRAAAEIAAIATRQGRPGAALRVSVSAGGCSGMQYGFTLDEIANDDDWNLDIGGVQILVDSMSGGYLQGAEVDYKEDQYGSSFSIKNPTAVTTCGCGSSFSPE